MSDNKLYSYTSMTETLASLVQDSKWLRVKQGLTIAQSIQDRVLQQDNAANTADLIILSEMVVNNNNDPKLDDKVRDLQHKQPYFKKYNRHNHKNKKHEWSLVKIDDIINEQYNGGFFKFFYDFGQAKNKEAFIDKHLFKNTTFMDAIEFRIYSSKQKAVKDLLDKNSYFNVVLRPWQRETVDEMLDADKKFNLLSLAPRFGKTFTVLEYTKLLAEKLKEDIILVPASKNLSSNASFVKDYTEGGYHVHGGFPILDNASLFRNEDLILEALKSEIPADTKIVLVTDEADIASHTSISREKLDAIHSNFNIIKQIAMSGTGIFKAAKIFKDIPEEDIFFKAINYTELMNYDFDELVKRNFFNIQLDTEEIRALNKQLCGDDEYLNIRQALDNAETYPALSTYLRKFVDDEKFATNLGLQQSDVSMIFLNASTKKKLKEFVKYFENDHPEIKVISITGDDTTNRQAEAKTKETLDLMKKNEDERKLVIFSMGMGSRSYSIPQIRRVIIVNDGFITPTFLQSSARCLTYNMLDQAPQAADILRVSFERCEIAPEIFMLENETCGYDDTTIERVTRFLQLNSFINVLLTNKEINTRLWESNETAVMAFIDRTLKFTDSTKYIMSKLYGEGIEVDVEGMKVKKSAGRTADTSAKNVKGAKDKKEKQKMAKEDEKALEAYVNIIRHLPYLPVLSGHNIQSVNDLKKIDWDFINISKELFFKNMKKDTFKNQIEAIFRAAENKTETEIIEKVYDFAEL